MTTHVKPQVATEIDEEACRQELHRILASRTFAKAPRLCSLLEYICHKSLDSRLDDLTEQQIGIHVFQRAPGYNSADDTIVRGTARYLRQRLDLYYKEEGGADAVRITVPKGSYVAHFAEIPFSRAPEADGFGAAAAPLLSPEFPPVYTSSTIDSWPRSAWIVTAVLLLIAFAALLTVARSRNTQTRISREAGPDALWRMLFTPGRKTLIVPGDASLDAFTSFDQRRITLPEYTEQYYQAEGSPRSRPGNGDVPLAKRSVTPMADLRLVAELVRVPQRLKLPEAEEWTEIRYARDMAIGDLRNSNLILIGSETFNPWVTLYEPSMDFNVHWDFAHNTYMVTDGHPQRDEPAAYTYDPKLSSSGAMSVVSYIENSQGKGDVLILQGTTMGATYGAMNMLLNEKLWKSVIGAATDRSGQLHHFDVLLESDFMRGGVSNTRILSTHVH